MRSGFVQEAEGDETCGLYYSESKEEVVRLREMAAATSLSSSASASLPWDMTPPLVRNIAGARSPARHVTELRSLAKVPGKDCQFNL
jgi:hypothetical protein